MKVGVRLFDGMDKIALGKALGVLALSWFALPVLYMMFKKKDMKKEIKEDDERIPSEG